MGLLGGELRSGTTEVTNPRMYITIVITNDAFRAAMTIVYLKRVQTSNEKGLNKNKVVRNDTKEQKQVGSNAMHLHP